MNTVSGSGSFSTSRATNYGMSGLVSGLDTEGMVESMLAGTQAKIDKQNADKQQTIWRQELYRSIIADINAFQERFFGTSSKTNFGSTSFFNTMSAVSSSKAFHVSASAEASSGKTSIQVGQLATASKLQSGTSVSGMLRGKLDSTALERRVVLTVDGTEVSLQLDEVPSVKIVDGREVKLTQEERLKSLAEQIGSKLSAQGAASIKAEAKDGKLTLSGGEIMVSAKSSQLGLEMLGVTAGQKSAGGSLSAVANPEAAVSFDMTLNGITRTIRLDGVTASSNLQQELQSRMDDAFGRGWVTVDTAGGEFTLVTNGKGNIASIAGNKTGLNLLGVESGESNKISYSQKLGDLNFAQKLAGDVLAFSINGTSFSFSGDQTLNDVVKAVNNSAAGVRITYSDIEDKFTLESASTGAGYEIKMQQTSGNLLNAMFGDAGVLTGSSVTGKELLSQQLAGSTDFGTGINSFKTGTFRFTVNGKGYSISVPQKENNGAYTREEVMKLINEGLASRFGYTGTGAGSAQAIELTGDAAGGYRLEVRNGAKVSFDDLAKEFSNTANVKEVRSQ